MEILLHHLLFSLSPALHHEPWSHGGTWPSGTRWLRSSLSRPLSWSLGSHCSPTGCLTLAMCKAVVVPDANVSDIRSNMWDLCKIRSRFSPLITHACVSLVRLHVSLETVLMNVKYLCSEHILNLVQGSFKSLSMVCFCVLTARLGLRIDKNRLWTGPQMATKVGRGNMEAQGGG